MNEKLHCVLVVGGTRGIGLELVRQFLDLKPTLLIATYRSLETAGELQELAAQNQALKLLKLDLADVESFASFATQVDQLTGDHGLTILVHNAGILINDHCGSITQDGLMRALTTNAVAPVLLTQHLLPTIQRSASKVENTKAVYISSCLGSIKRNDGDRPSHRMSKAALNQGKQFLLLATNIEFRKNLIPKLNLMNRFA